MQDKEPCCVQPGEQHVVDPALQGRQPLQRGLAAVRRGDNLCRISGVFGDVLEEIAAPRDGLFVRATTMGTVSQGERAATLGLP